MCQVFLLAVGLEHTYSYADDFSVDGGMTVVYQKATDGETDAELSGSFDLFLHRQTGAGEWLVYVEGNSGLDADSVSSRFPNANADAGTAVNSSDNGRLQISELNFTFDLDDGASLMLGLVDPSAWLDRSRRANDENQHFLNESFVNNATIAFPDYTLGAVFRRASHRAWPEITVLVTGSDGLGNVPSRSYDDVFDLTDEGRGMFVGVGASWVRERVSFRTGAWLRTDEHPVIGRPSSSEDNYGAYGVFGWYPGSYAIIVRGGIANERVSSIGYFAAVAFEKDTPIGLFGAGLAQTFVSGHAVQSNRSDGVDAEIFLRTPVLNKRAHITPSIQYVRNPVGPVQNKISGLTTSVAGLRFRFNF